MLDAILEKVTPITGHLPFTTEYFIFGYPAWIMPVFTEHSASGLRAYGGR
jgi:hypothetical protein